MLTLWRAIVPLPQGVQVLGSEVSALLSPPYVPWVPVALGQKSLAACQVTMGHVSANNAPAATWEGVWVPESSSCRAVLACVALGLPRRVCRCQGLASVGLCRGFSRALCHGDEVIPDGVGGGEGQSRDVDALWPGEL